ncbi:9006_t:CDS:2 [Acaulospora morrowiae]|uniref:9006_t:CDS:1 n=1 Tax=Acaulospora morrowiae TaxID=94023 RepID=A0A9N9F9F0_9GLOM|nr:9006_t:CDS:2 [Acaulospora morrowiae]
MHAEIIYNRAIKVARELEQCIYTNTFTYNTENHESNPEHFSESVEIPFEGIDIIIDESKEMSTMNDKDLMAENTETLVFKSQMPDDLLTRYPADDPAGKWNLADLFIVKFLASLTMKNLQLVYDVDNSLCLQ